MHRLSKPLCYLYKLPKMLRSRRRTFTLPTNLKYLVHVRYSTSKLFERVAHLQSKVAITDANDKKQYTYANILRDSASVACNLQLQKGEIKGKRICFLFDPSYEYVVTMLGIWRAGAVAVPLCNSHPTKELEYYIKDSQSELVLYSQRFEDVIAPLKQDKTVKYQLLSEVKDQIHAHRGVFDCDEQYDIKSRALFVYTSGTTGPPKGVVSTHETLLAQISSLVKAWEWTSKDHILHILPLHHVHGIVNVLLCALYVGASLTFMKFDATQVYNALFNDQIVNQGGDFTLFMAVPTIYVKLIAHHKEKFGDALIVSKKNERFRLMVSGSAALPEPTFYAWRNITGHTLLERYGMTEIGMALSNPLHPVEKRIPGTVGTPLPFVSVKLDDPQFVDGVNQGELLVSGPTVFHEYWNKPEATAKTFKGEWFVTGDLASIDQDGVYRILGRLNADIIKTGGYKVSALDIEHVMMSHPSIAECAVLGVPDKEWGERVAALVVLNKEKTLSLDELKEFLSEKLAKYKLPTILKIVKEIPRNQMGKVSKKQLVRDFENL